MVGATPIPDPTDDISVDGPDDGPDDGAVALPGASSAPPTHQAPPTPPRGVVLVTPRAAPAPAASPGDGPNTRVRALPLLTTATFTSLSDKRLATAILPSVTSIGDLARALHVDVAHVRESIADFKELGLVELLEPEPKAP
jgi:hypothetical protein